MGEYIAFDPPAHPGSARSAEQANGRPGRQEFRSAGRQIRQGLKLVAGKATSATPGGSNAPGEGAGMDQSGSASQSLSNSE